MRKNHARSRILAAILLAMFMILGTATPAFAANGGTALAVDPSAPAGAVTKVAVTFYGDPETSKGFTWYTTAASVGSDLELVKKTGKTANFSGAGVMRFTGSCAVPTNAASTTVAQAQEYLHKAEATGLKPGTAYWFRVGDASINLWSDVGTFTTAPSCGSFTFLDLADPQAKELDEAQLSADTFKKAVATVPNASFIALNGDVVDDGSKEYEWDWLFENMKGVMLNYTFAPVPGNHEKNDYSFIDHFDLSPAPGSPTVTGAYYSFDYLNAHFVMLNNNENSTQYSDFSPEQIEWMKADVQQARANGAQWIIAVMHKGPYTTSNHATDADIMGAAGVRTLVAPIMENLGIDLVLQGHDHIYARSKPIRADGTAGAETIITENFKGRKVQYEVQNNGTVYLIPNTAGPKVYYKNTSIDPGYYSLFDVADESHAAVYGPDPADATRPMRSQIQNFSSITVEGGRLTVISYEIDQNKNSAQPYVIDTFGIIKDVTPPVITIKPYGKTLTNRDITVCAAANEGTLNAASHTFTENGSFEFVATDAAGNVSRRTVTIRNIDKTCPVITVKTNKGAAVTSGDTVHASYIKVTYADEHFLTKRATLNGRPVSWPRNGIFKAHGAYAFTVKDKAGNTSTFKVKLN